MYEARWPCASPWACGATKLEAEQILFAAKRAVELARPDLPKWKKLCLETYVACKEENWKTSCYDCFRSCEGQQGEWPEDKCHSRKKGP
ncbi:DUF3795 domain-containing protein [Corallococcus soli]